MDEVVEEIQDVQSKIEKVQNCLEPWNLSSAIWMGDMNQVRKFLNEGADPNEVINDEQAPLMTAVMEENSKTIRLLAVHGADLNLKD